MWLLLMTALTGLSVTDLDWSVVNDTVMGGISRSTVTAGETVAFQGELSLEQNGGFASARAPLPPGGLPGVRALKLSLRGDGRVYDVTLRRSDVPLRAGSYRVQVQTQANAPTEVTLPLADFRPTAFGRPVPGAPALDTDLARIDTLGVLLADKQPGPFSLEILSVETVPGAASRGPGHAAAIAQLQAAVAQGVPRFNRGDAAGCAAIYAQALESLREDPALTAGERQIIEEALEAARDLDPVGAAWALRGAIDTVLASA